MLWYRQREKGSVFLLKLSFLLVKFCPNFILKPIVFLVSFVYFLFSKEERASIRAFHRNLSGKEPSIKTVFLNFYNFAISICDKIAVWIGKIGFDDVVLENKELILKSLISKKRGSIIISAHFGNIEVARALSGSKQDIKLAILAHNKNMMKFATLINEISSKKIEVFEVSNLDIEKMVKFNEFLDSGGHLCVMADRVPISSDRVLKVDFLDKVALFPTGSFELARLLKASIVALWCIKDGDKYHISIDEIAKEVRRDSVKNSLNSYVRVLEKRCKEFPNMWFNFYDFWSKDDKKSL